MRGETRIFLNQFPMRYNLPLAFHPHLLPQIAQQFFRQDVTMLTAPPETNEFHGPLTSHVGELRSAARGSGLSGNPHGSSNLCGAEQQNNFQI